MGITQNRLIRIQNKKVRKQPQTAIENKGEKTYIITAKDLVQYCKTHKKMHQLYALVYSYRYNKYFWYLTPTQSKIINHIITFDATHTTRFNNILEFSQKYINLLKKCKFINNIPISFIHDEMIPYNTEDKQNHSPIKGTILPPTELKTINPYNIHNIQTQ